MLSLLEPNLHLPSRYFTSLGLNVRDWPIHNCRTHRTWYRPAIALPASGVIAATGLFWTIQRIALAVR